MSEGSDISKEQIQPLIPEESPKDKMSETLDRRLGRRSFLKKAAATTVAAGVSTFVGFPTAKDAAESQFRPQELTQEIETNNAFLQERYGLNIYFQPPDEKRNFELKGSELSLAEKRNVLLYIKQEAAKYPPEYFKIFLKPKYILILNNLRVDKSFQGGFVSSELNIFDPHDPTKKNKQSIYLSKNLGLLNFYQLFGWQDAQYFSHKFHHEFLHLADFREESPYQMLEEWTNLNPEKEDAYVGENYSLTSQRPAGFATPYGKASAVEDRAEVAQLLLNDYRGVLEIASKDEIFSSKLQKCKEDYYRRSQGKMNKQYWQDLADGKVNESYWDQKSARQ